MIRKAKAVWHGTLRAGSGNLSTDSGVLADTPYSFKTRFENEKGTNPEELIAAAHAGCFTMVLAFGLQGAASPRPSSAPRRPSVSNRRARDSTPSPLTTSYRPPKARIVRPRQIACYLAKNLTKLSLSQIGKRIGGRDHTTVLHSIQKVERLMVSDELLANQIDALWRQFIMPNPEILSPDDPTPAPMTFITEEEAEEPAVRRLHRSAR